MHETKFKLNDGREIIINYTQRNGTPRYTVLIDGQTQERNIACGIGWSAETIEKSVRDKYETQNIPTVKDAAEHTPNKYNAKSKKITCREIRSANFRLEGLILIADLRLKQKTTDLKQFF